MGYLEFYFIKEDTESFDESEKIESVLTSRSNFYQQLEFVRRSFKSYLQKGENVVRAFDKEGYIYNYNIEIDKVFKSKTPDLSIIEFFNKEDNESIFGY